MRIPFFYASPVLTVFSHSAASDTNAVTTSSKSSGSKVVSSVRAQDHSQLTDSEGMTAHFPGLLFTTAWRLRSADSLALLLQQECQVGNAGSQLPSVSTAEHTPTPTDHSTGIAWCKSYPLLSHRQMNPITTGHSHASNTYNCSKHT